MAVELIEAKKCYDVTGWTVCYGSPVEVYSIAKSWFPAGDHAEHFEVGAVCRIVTHKGCVKPCVDKVVKVIKVVEYSEHSGLSDAVHGGFSCD